MTTTTIATGDAEATAIDPQRDTTITDDRPDLRSAAAPRAPNAGDDGLAPDSPRRAVGGAADLVRTSAARNPSAPGDVRRCAAPKVAAPKVVVPAPKDHSSLKTA